MGRHGFLSLAVYGMVSVVLVSAPAEVFLEHFDTDPGWDGVNNRATTQEPRTIHQDFGYAPDISLGPFPGAVGDRITPDARAAYYGIPLDELTLDDPFSASGTLEMKPGGEVFLNTVGRTDLMPGYLKP